MKRKSIYLAILSTAIFSNFAVADEITSTTPTGQTAEVINTLSNSYSPTSPSTMEKNEADNSRKPIKPPAPQAQPQPVALDNFNTAKQPEAKPKAQAVTTPDVPDYSTIIVRSKRAVTAPSAVTNVADQKAKQTALPAELPKDFNLPTDGESRVDITVKPGVTQIVKISKDYLNRIITPFQNPILPTTSDFDYNVSDNIIYLTPKGNSPISAFITDKNNQKTSINVLLVPDNILPREIIFHVEGMDNNSENLSTDALEEMLKLNGNKTDSYLDQITNMMTEIAKGNVPTGYNPAEVKRSKSPQCRFTQMESAPLQSYESINRRIIVYKVTNRADKNQPITESACYRKGVVAVSAYPYVNLEPNQSTELYVLTDKSYTVETTQKREILVK
jgi:conjugal transfer pilus assembly protein TraK